MKKAYGTYGIPTRKITYVSLYPFLEGKDRKRQKAYLKK